MAGASAVGFGVAWMVGAALNPAQADRQVVPDTPSPSPSVNVRILSPSPSETPLPAGQVRVKLSLFGVRLIASDPIADLVYGEVDNGPRKLAGFTTESLLAKYPLCKPGALGALYRKEHLASSASPTPSRTPSPTPSYTPKYTPTPSPVGKNGFVKTIGKFDYYYQPPGYSDTACASDQFGSNALAEAKAAVINAALPTLSP